MIDTPERLEQLPLTVIKNIVALSTSGFGLVVALAWNEVVRKVVESYIDPYLGRNSGLISLFIYAVIMTVLAILVTMQLTGLQRKLENLQARVDARKQQAAAKEAQKK